MHVEALSLVNILTRLSNIFQFVKIRSYGAKSFLKMIEKWKYVLDFATFNYDLCLDYAMFLNLAKKNHVQSYTTYIEFECQATRLVKKEVYYTLLC